MTKPGGSQHKVDGITHYERNKVRYKQRAMGIAAHVRAFVYRVKRRSCCKDCGNRNPLVLEFDHLRDKEANIARVATNGWSIERVKREMRKCEIVCANCHKIRTHMRRLLPK